MTDDNRRPEHPICNNTNGQKYGDDDWRNEVFHGLSLTGELDGRQQSASFSDAVGALGCEPERNVVGPHYNTPESIAAARARQASSIRA